MDFQQSNTFRNIQNAFGLELESCAKYELYAKEARQEVLLSIGYMFDTSSRNDQFIAERLRRILMGSTPNTLQNLTEANDDAVAISNIYREYSRKATEEGYSDISSLFAGIANIKLNHSYSFSTTADNMARNELFCKSEEGLWICLGCGNILSGLCAPEICPICGYPQGYYELLRFM